MRPFRAAHAVDGKGKEAIGRSAAPLRVARREMGPDITVGESAENCICQCMQGDVGIRMTGEGLRMRNADSPECHVIARAESVDIETGAGPHVTEHRRIASPRRVRNLPAW